MKTVAAKAKIAEVKKGGAATGKTAVGGDKASIEQMVADMRDNVMMQQQEQDMRLNTMTQKIVYVKRVLMGILNGGAGGNSTKPKINVSVNGQNQNAMMGAETEADDFEDMEGLDDIFADVGVDELWDM